MTARTSRTIAALAEAMQTAKDREEIYGEAEVGHARLGRVLYELLGSVSLGSPKDFVRFHLLATIAGKLCRYVQQFENGGHRDSIHDAGIYCLLLQIEDEDEDESRGL